MTCVALNDAAQANLTKSALVGVLLPLFLWRRSGFRGVSFSDS
jgi:hypothetical protein